MLGKMDTAGHTQASHEPQTPEEHFAIGALNRSIRVDATSLAMDDHSRVFGPTQGHLLVVTSAERGPDAPREASGATTDRVVRTFLEDMPWAPAHGDEHSDAELELACKRREAHMQDCLGRLDELGPEGSLVLAYVVWPYAHVLQVGTHGAYRLRAGELERIVSRPGIQRVKLELGDSLLLCTEGVWSALSEAQLVRHLQLAADAEQASRELTAAASSGDRTAVVARFLPHASQAVPAVIEPQPARSASAPDPHAKAKAREKPGAKPEPDEPPPYTRTAALGGLLAPLAWAEADAVQPELGFSWEATRATLVETLGRTWEGVLERLPFVIGAALVLMGTALIAWTVRKIARPTLRRTHLRRSLQELAARLLHMGTWFAGILIAAMVVFPGLTPSKALSALGIASVAVGLAFKDIFENFFAGILILWRFPFDKGDFIETGDLMGRVEEITIRNTLIRKPTDELIVVPNSQLFTNPVEVLTDKDRRRVTVSCGVAYEADVAEARRVIEQAVEGCASVCKDHPIQVFTEGLGASSVDIEVAWWASPEPLAMRRSRGEVLDAIKSALDEAGIEIPFPQRVLSFKPSGELASTVRELATSGSLPA